MFNQGLRTVEGYQNITLVDTIIAKNIDYQNAIRTQDLPELSQQANQTFSAINLLIPEKDQYRVLDFGGGGGHHFAEAQTMFPDKKFRWHVIETEGMVEAARKNIHKQELEFHSTIEKVNNHQLDLVFCNSALQYTDEPVETLQSLISLRPNFIYLTRIPLTYGRSFSYIQKSKIMDNGPGSSVQSKSIIKYKCHVEDFSKFRQTLGREFNILAIFKESGWDNLPPERMVNSFTIVARLKQIANSKIPSGN
jgi:putative methyltransferase (TIGR04325 family)